MIPLDVKSKPNGFETWEQTPKNWSELVIPAVQSAFANHCAYLGHWISSGEVDHFHSVKRAPQSEWYWANFRWGEPRVNNLKRLREFLDPFTIGEDWIRFDPTTSEYTMGAGLPKEYYQIAEMTLKVLNDKQLLRAREQEVDLLVKLWRKGEKEYVENFFPLLAKELNRHICIST